MSLLERAALKALHLIEPERAHGLAEIALIAGFAPKGGPFTTGRLATEIAGLVLPNPIGLAAGFDKSAKLLAPLSRVGFGFIEVGAATPLMQQGNPKPRLFRLPRDRAVINRFGFNNAGMELIGARLSHHERAIPVGLNLGANKDSADRAGDFAKVLAHCGPHIDFATVNVSSPNTVGLRDLQGREALADLLGRVMDTARALPAPCPVFLKIAPDLDAAGLEDVAEAALQAGVAGIVATNTTLDREGLKSASREEAGGLSGAPLFEKSTRVLAQLYRLTGGSVALIGVGGVGSAEDAYAKLQAGASAVQLYTALVYRGFSLVAKIARGLDELLARDGYSSVAEAVGTKAEDWT